MSTGILVLSPEGQYGSVPKENLEEAQSRGFRIATHVVSPEGVEGLLPLDKAGEAVKRGFTIGQKTPKFDEANRLAQMAEGTYAHPVPAYAPGGPSLTNVYRVAQHITEPVQRAMDLAGQLIRTKAASMDTGNLADVNIPTGVSPEEALAGAPESVTIPGEAVGKAYKKVIAPLGEAAAEQVGGLYQPENLATLGAASAIRGATPAARLTKAAADLYFRGQAAVGAGQQLGTGLAKAEQGDVPGAVKDIAGATVGTGFAVSEPGRLREGLAQTPADIAAASQQAGRAVVRATPAAIGSRIYPESVQTGGQIAYRELRQASHRAANLAASLEMGGQADKGVRAYEDISRPILDDVRAEAARQGKTEADFKGRRGYEAAKEITQGVRASYDQAYDTLVEPLRDEPVGEAARKAASAVVNRMVNDASLMDEIQRGSPDATNVQQLRNIAGTISRARTIGELDTQRVALNRLASKYLGKSEAQQYQSPLVQESLSEGASAIRNALYEEMALRYGGGTAPMEVAGGRVVNPPAEAGVPVEQIRELQRNHGAAIQADNLMEQTGRALSQVASGEGAGPEKWRIAARLGYRATLTSKPHAVAGVLEKLLGGSDLDLFNSRMKRVIRGAEAGEGTTFPTPPITPEYVGPKGEGPTGTEVPRPGLPPSEGRRSYGQQMEPRALPPGAQLALPGGQEALPPGPQANNPNLRLGPIRLPETPAPAQPSVEAVGIPQTAEATALQQHFERQLTPAEIGKLPPKEAQEYLAVRRAQVAAGVPAALAGTMPKAPAPEARGPAQTPAITPALSPPQPERGAATTQGVQSQPMPPEKGAGEKGAQPTKQTPAGAMRGKIPVPKEGDQIELAGRRWDVLEAQRFEAHPAGESGYELTVSPVDGTEIKKFFLGDSVLGDLPKSEPPPAPAKGAELTGRGTKAPVLAPSGQLAATYRVIDASQLKPSHDAFSFAPNPAYPTGVQERAYHTSKEAQTRVIQQAQNYLPEFTVNNNPDAVNGPPVVTPDGTVLGGNSRVMSTQRLYAGGRGDLYRNYLREHAAEFGLKPEDVDATSNPVLVREIPQPRNAEEMRRIGSDLNKSMTGALGVSERAVSAGKSIKPESLSQIGAMLDSVGEGATLRDLMRERGKDLVSMLSRDGVITDRERPQFVDTSTGGLSEEGKTFVERALLGSVVDDPVLMERAPKSILNKIDGSLADLSQLGGRTDEYNLMPLLREALNQHAEIAQRGTTVDLHLGQTGMFGPPRNPAVDALVRALALKPTEVRAALKAFAQDANFDQPGQATLALGEKPTPTAAFNAAFKTNLSEREFVDSLLNVLRNVAQSSGNLSQGARRGSIAGTKEAGTGATAEGLQQPSSKAATAGPAFRAAENRAGAEAASQNPVGPNPARAAFEANKRKRRP